MIKLHFGADPGREAACLHCLSPSPIPLSKFLSQDGEAGEGGLL